MKAKAKQEKNKFLRSTGIRILFKIQTLKHIVPTIAAITAKQFQIGINHNLQIDNKRILKICQWYHSEKTQLLKQSQCIGLKKIRMY